MSRGEDNETARLILVVLFSAIGILLGVGVYYAIIGVNRTDRNTRALKAQIARLDRTDRIACAFINADANVRAKQAHNSAAFLLQQDTYLGAIVRAKKHTEQVVGLFNHRPKNETPKQRANTDLFVNYLLGEASLRQSQRAVEQAREHTTKANLRLTRGLVVQARALAVELHC